MALKQLMLSKKITQRKEDLAEHMKQSEALKTRSDSVEAALEEARSDEELAAVDEEISQLDKDQTEFDEKKSALENEISDLEGELEELNSKLPSGEQRNINVIQQRTNVENGGKTGMIKRGFFKGVSYEQRNALVSREEVKEFLQRARELGAAQNRAVTNAELLIPDVLLELLKDNLHRYSKLISRVRLKSVPGTTRTNIAGAIPEGVWTEACGVLNELNIVFNQVETDGYKVGGYVSICNATLSDSDINLADEIMDSIGQAIGFAADKAIGYGTGVKMPVGIVTRLAQTTKPAYWEKKAPEWKDLHGTHIIKLDISKSAVEFYSDLILALGSVKANYSTGGKFWAMNSTTLSTLRAKALSINAAGAIVSGQTDTMPIVGGDVDELDFIPDGDIWGGYGSLYLLAEREGTTLAKSEHVQFIEDNTVFKGTARYDGKPVFGESFVLVNIKNQNPTTTIPFAPDTANENDEGLSVLSIGSLTLSPAFSTDNENYTAATSNATNNISATPKKQGAEVVIKVNGTVVNNGSPATWNTGTNTVVITVTSGAASKTYTVEVTKS